MVRRAKIIYMYSPDYGCHMSSHGLILIHLTDAHV